MTVLANRVEILKLAHALEVEPDELSDLGAAPPEAVRELRDAFTESLFHRHQARFRRMAKVAASVPAPLSARIAQTALTPLLAARVAAVMEPDLAVNLAKSLTTTYLADLSVALDPQRSAAIVARIPEDQVAEIGAMLVERKAHVTLGRFVSIIEPDIAMRVVDSASGFDVLQVALFAEDLEALDHLIGRCSEAQLSAAITAAHEHALYDDAVTLIVSVQETTRRRLVPLIAALPTPGIDAFAASVQRHDAWASLLPALTTVDDDVLTPLANSAPLLEDDVLSTILGVASELGLDQVPQRLDQVFDDAHRSAARKYLTSS